MDVQVRALHPWTEDRVGLCEAGDVGGDVQASNAWSRRFTRLRRDGRYDVIKMAYYVARSESGEVWISEDTELTICTDTADVGGTEEWGDIEYGECDGSTEEDAKRYAEKVSIDRLTPFELRP